MDPSRFDDVLRTLSAHRSRRSLVAALVVTLLRGSTTAAQTTCLTLNKKCTKKPRKLRCCSGLRCHRKRCRPPQCRLGSQGTPCGDGGLCCAGFCLDVRADPRNCGACGRTCLTSERCLGGDCVSPCLAGLTDCGGACVDVLSDQDHCGGCGHACQVGAQCRNGECVGTRCKDDGQACQESTECCRFPESACLNLGVTRVCSRACVGRGAQCLNSAPGPFCCTGLTCVGGRCTQDQQPPCVAYGQACSATRPCCDDVPCSGGLCRFN
jgi:hypothetical protein